MAKHHNYHIGDRVEDRESHRPGTVVHLYTDRQIADELIAVRFDDNEVALCVHIDDMRRIGRRA